jgi:rubredoxin
MPRGRPKPKIRDVLSDDVVWLNRTRPYTDWARLLGYHHKAVQQDMLARGWKRDVKGDVIQAPCAGCSEPHEFGALDDSRMCPRCSTQLDVFDPVTTYREERARRNDLAALREWRDQTRRAS